MAKRQTTGLPKNSRLKQEEELSSQGTWFDKLLGNPRTRHDRDEAINRFIQRSIGLVGLVIALLIAAALIYEFLIVPNQAVATVNGQNITVAAFREQVKFERAYVLQQANARYSQAQQQAAAFGMDVNQLLQNDTVFQQWNQEIQFTDALGQRVLDDMIDDVLVQQELERRGLSVDDTSIQNQENDFFGYDPTQVALIGTPGTETPTPTITPTPFVSPTPTSTPLPSATPVPVETTPEAEVTVEAEATAEVTQEVALAATIAPSPTPSQADRLADFEETQDLFREIIREQGEVGNTAVENFFLREARRTVLREAMFGADTATYVNARHILVATVEEADTILAALNAGESFADLAKAHSTDTGSGARGGELGWSPVSNFVAEFSAAATTAEIGALVGPVETEFGFHIIQVRAREDREVEGSQLESIQRNQFAAWLETFREENEATISISSNWPDYLGD